MRFVLIAICASALPVMVLFAIEQLAPRQSRPNWQQFLVYPAVALAAAGLVLAFERSGIRRTITQSGLDRLVADLPVAVYQGILTPDGQFQRHYLTPSFVRVTGWTVEQVADDAAYIALVPNDDRPYAEAHHGKAVRDGDAVSEYRLQRPDGSVGWFRHQTRLIASTDEGAELIGTLSDITSAHELTARTAASEARFRGFLEASPDAIIVTDEDGLVVMASQRVEAIFGYKPSDLIGRPHSILVPDTLRRAHADHVRDFLGAPQVRDMGQGRELRGRRQDGSEFPAEITLSPYRAAEGLFIVSAVRDVTLRQRAQDQLRQAQKMEAVGQLTGGVAHDFNNLLTTILGNVELLEWGDKAFDAESGALIAAIHRAGQRAALLIKQLLAFSRERPLKPQTIDLNGLIDGMSDMLRRTLGERVVVEVTLADGLWSTQVDVNQLENAILNLAINARDAMRDGGRLTIETGNTLLDDDYAAANVTSRAGAFVMITVNDSGTGMTAETLRHAFDPFYTTKPIGKGTGLGLSQVNGFVKDAGGHIKLSSEPGHGTTVKICLPRHLSTGEPDMALSASPEMALVLGTETVLVVEDKAAVRTFCAAALARLGYHVLTADNADAALRLMEREPGIALLFTDIGLPGVNGSQLADEARRRWPALKVLFTTAYAPTAIPLKQETDRDVHLLSKPYTISNMAKRVRDILDGC
jgi:PAS domain S-box-containing protein